MAINLIHIKDYFIPPLYLAYNGDPRPSLSSNIVFSPSNGVVGGTIHYIV